MPNEQSEETLAFSRLAILSAFRTLARCFGTCPSTVCMMTQSPGRRLDRESWDWRFKRLFPIMAVAAEASVHAVASRLGVRLSWLVQQVPQSKIQVRRSSPSTRWTEEEEEERLEVVDLLTWFKRSGRVCLHPECLGSASRHPP